MENLVKKGSLVRALLGMGFALCLMSGLGLQAAAGEWVQSLQ